MKYFVTGATGFVGNVVVRKLRAAGHEVNATVRNPAAAKDLSDLGTNLFQGDVTVKESMRAAMQGTDGVFHIAGWYKIGTRDKRGGQRVNVQGTRNVLELMKELGIRKGVYTSTLAINSSTHGKAVDETYHYIGKPLSEYDRTKAVAHNIASEFIQQGLPLVIVMPGVIYGPGDTSNLRTNIIAFLKGQLPVVPGEAGSSFAHVDDIAQGHILAMEKGRVGETYIIGGEPYTYEGAFKLASRITGKRMPMTVSPGMINIMSALSKPFDPILPPTYTSESLRVLAGVTYMGDNSKARRELGYNPRPFEEGWTETVRHEMNLLGMS